MIQDHSDHGANANGTNESTLGKDSLVPLMHMIFIILDH